MSDKTEHAGRARKQPRHDGHRILLRRDAALLGSAPVKVLWIMCNPSTADDSADDPTVRRVAGFTERVFGSARIRVLNLFTKRCTRPRALDCGDSRSNVERADSFIASSMDWAEHVVFAWGSGSSVSRRKAFVARAERVVELAGQRGCRPKCLGLTKDGFPKHPLYVPYAAQLPHFPIGGHAQPVAAPGAAPARTGASWIRR